MTTVLCHGCWDILHYGHLKHFEEAKKHGDRLIVSITSDAYVNKGPGRPYFTTEKRARMVRSIQGVDEVYISDEPTALGAIRKFRPDVYAKGPDYKDASKDITGEIINEKKEVESYGGKIIFTEEETHSSSQIINKYFQPFTESQRTSIETVKLAGGGSEACEKAISRLSDLRILVTGEPIIDVYRFVRPEGISSKSPSISCRYEYEEAYEGGAMAIWKHLSSFAKVDFKFGHAVRKIRYISGTQRVFEVTEIDDTYRPQSIPDGYDCYVVADFGHGMFQGGELDNLKGFVGLNVQTNSSNFGFNLYHKHDRWDYLCLDTREARLGRHSRLGTPLQLAMEIKEECSGIVGLTAGPNGAYLITTEGNQHYSPAYSDVVIDATGAGDAYFAITTCLLASGCDPRLVPFIGNVFAGLKTRIMGNKEAVSKVSLLKAIRGILA